MTGDATRLRGEPEGQDDFEILLAAAREGAAWAVERLFHRFHPPLLRYLRAEEPAEAEDLAAQVWLSLVPRLPLFVGDESALRGWIFTVARRCLIGYRRQKARRRTAPVPMEDLAGRSGSDDPAESGMATLATQQAIERLIACLPAAQAEVVLLRVVAGLSAQEVATVTGRTPAGVRVLQHRALRRLAARFPKEGVTE